MEKIIEIHESLVNGNRKQMVSQIDEYGLYDFWKDYSDYLKESYLDFDAAYSYLTDAIASYHRIKNR